jgi:23S rRNA pseudouridine1911/1915/1917 synthase
MVDINIIYEDDNVLVLNKPAGLVVTPGAGVEEADTLVGWLLNKYGDSIRQVGVEAHRPGIVHRLDKDTSGVMIAAKNQESFLHLIDQFKARTVIKEYQAFVGGDLSADYRLRDYDTNEFVIDAPIGRNPRMRTRFIVIEDGKPARTKFVVEEKMAISSEAGIERVKCMPVTGRTHQIRVHLKSFGYSVFGDPIYASRKQRNLFIDLVRKRRITRRMYLHAYNLTLTLPGEGTAKTFSAPLPEAFTLLRPAGSFDN